MILFWFFILGLIFGSFGNVLIHRLPRNESIFYPSSHCIKCHKKLKIYHNIPIISWIFLGGKCSFCKDKISPNYPFIELFSGLLAVLVIYFESGFYQNINTLVILKSAILSLNFINLLCLSVIDMIYKAVPDMLLIVGLILAVAYEPNIESIICGVVFMAAFWLIRLIVSKAKNSEAMGSADIFIIGIIAIILGYLLGFVAIYIAAILTLPFYIGKRGLKLAFVPFLSAGLIIAYSFKSEIYILIGKIYE